MTDPEALWQQLPLAALIIGPADDIRGVNPAAESFLNLSDRALAGQGLGRISPETAALAAALARVRRDEAPLTLAEAGMGPAGAEVSCRLMLSPIGEEVLCLILPEEAGGRMGRDQQAKAAARSASGLAAMLAHEIKNPLAGIAGAAQLLEMNLGPQDRELTAMIVEETRRIVKLLEQVERFGNLSPPRRQVCNIHDITDRARRLAELGQAAHMRILEDYDPSLPAIHVDPDQMVQVVLNLLKNAAEAAGPAGGGTIRLRTRVDHGLRRRNAAGLAIALPVTLEVIDDGPGIAPDLLPQIFDPFVSGRPNGTGLGLALVSKVINDHGGWIGVDSRPGRTAFRIALPLAPRE